MTKNSSQSGFGGLQTLIAVVLLGIIFMMTLKGGELVASIRAFITASEIQQYQDRVNVYYNLFQALPGDDIGAPARWGRNESVFIMFNAPVSYEGDDKIQGLFSDFGNATGEQFTAWRDLRFAGLIDGDPALVGQSAMPENLFGGRVGFAESSLGLQDVLCLTEIPGLAASRIDQRIDDGWSDRGSLRASSQWDHIAEMSFDVPDSEPYDPEKTYIICLPYFP